ncbi:alpha/beta hydrolase [Xinfangfangia pollutisoli]|uniref:alpha/beta hydrolase n=1 Tax=Xinfangfangia pollutisoli TaxID=2865960 RepID=UPI001CD47E93|nr:alpha/beta fold hydrolase [Xinfangfangia pollutisoli]
MKPFPLAQALAALFLSAPVGAVEMQIPGPLGPLAAQAIAVQDARHVVVLIPGSGPTDRDGNGPLVRSDTYRLLAEGLAEAGIASVRIDKRGLFSSAGAIADPNAVTLADYAADARAWVVEAQGLAPCVWLMGHSEGGLVALLAAGDPPPGLCGVILLATPGRKVGQLMVEQVAANPAMFFLMGEMRAIVADLEAGTPRPAQTIPLPLRPLFPPELQPYLIDVFAHDPAQLAAGWSGPALIVQGGRDIQVTPADADILARAMPQARRQDLPLATHMLKDDLPGQPFATYANPALPLDPALIPAISAFLP